MSCAALLLDRPLADLAMLLAVGCSCVVISALAINLMLLAVSDLRRNKGPTE